MNNTNYKDEIIAIRLELLKRDVKLIEIINKNLEKLVQNLNLNPTRKI